MGIELFKCKQSEDQGRFISSNSLIHIISSYATNIQLTNY